MLVSVAMGFFFFPEENCGNVVGLIMDYSNYAVASSLMHKLSAFV